MAASKLSYAQTCPTLGSQEFQALGIVEDVISGSVNEVFIKISRMYLVKKLGFLRKDIPFE
jgi:hypothetical protein